MRRLASQREVMRELFRRYGADEERIVREYAKAEKRGEVQRKSNAFDITPEQYARALWRDAVRKGWISSLH